MSPHESEEPRPPIAPVAIPARAHAIQSTTLSDAPSRRIMPPDLSITLRPGTGADTVRATRERGPRRQSMRGFEDTYTDIVDYIVRITHRIWEDQDVGYIYDTYSPACMVYENGPHSGVERIVEGTLASINAFPDNRGIADDVIRENEIIEEWVMHNLTAKLAQLGIDVKRAARQYGNEMLAGSALAIGTGSLDTEIQRLDGGRGPQPYKRLANSEFDVEDYLRGLWHDIYHRRDLSAVDRYYARTARWRGPSNRIGYGRQDVKAMARALLTTFPDLGMQVDEVYWMGNADEGFRASVRWSAQGTHRGWGLYGEPTGRRVHLRGINQLYIRDAVITEDWMMFNEFEVLAQLLADEPVDLSR